MKRVDQRKVRAITEQTTRNALNEQQLSEGGFIKGLGTALWNGGKNFFRGAGTGLAGRAGRSLGFGAKQAMKNYRTATSDLLAHQNAVMQAARGDMRTIQAMGDMNKFFPNAGKTFVRGGRTPAEMMKNTERLGSHLNQMALDAEKAGNLATRLARNSARAKGLGFGLAGGGLLGAGLAGGSSSSPSPAYSDPQMSSTPTVYPMPQSNNPYAGYGGGYGGMDPYTAYASTYGGVDPYAAYYSGAYSDPYAAYYSGAYSDPYAAYYGGAYSNPYGGGGSSSNNMDLATMMALMNQGGDSSTLPMLMAMNGGNIDDQTLQMMMMMNQGGGNDIWGLGGYHA